MATLQQQVQQHLDSTGISLRELSRRSGVSRTTISKILRGGTYKSDTAHALYCSISITPISEYVTLHDKVEAIAADCVDHDEGWEVDLQCAKYRRVMQLEKELGQSKAEVGIVREQRNKLAFACEQLTADLEAEKRNFAALEQVHEQREQHLKSCENALIEADQKLNDANTAWVSLNTQHGTTTQQLRDARAEIKRLKSCENALIEAHVRDTDLECAKYRRIMALEAELDAWQLKCGKERDKAEKLQWSLNKSEASALVVTKDLQIMQASWKAACVRSEQLQKQLDHGHAQFKSLHDAYNQQVDDEREMLAQIDTLFAERDNTATKHDQQVMRLRVRCFALVCAIVFLIVGNLVVWGAA